MGTVLAVFWTKHHILQPEYVLTPTTSTQIVNGSF